MGRRSSAPPSRSAPAPARRAPPPAAAPARSAPPPAPHAPAPAPSPMQSSSGGGGMLSGLGSTMAQGFAFGTGSALAREAVGSIFGGHGSSAPAPAAAAPTPAPVASAPPSACDLDLKSFQSCMEQNTNNSSICDSYYNALQACQSRM